ncbi:MerR family transcriptional regulator [Nocardia sp. BMG111209]|uniref:MerR family transcriptional regulator n=1 Tax=Nocardia sp. BMG111209 TaxID=1160137 RepID=UPI00037DB6D5|nr:MerR family transcriptional regulator [Nocardia sp. BMG111209]
MRISELAERTGTPARLLRYYEEQGLIRVGRSPNGYRDYDERLADQVIHIRGLLDAGLPTRLIKQILPCLEDPADIHFADASPEIIATLEQQRDRLTQRIELLTRNRDAMTAYVASLRTCTGV